MLKSFGMAVLLWLMLWMAVPIQAQTPAPEHTAAPVEESPMETLFSGMDFTSGGYGAMHFGGTQANGETVAIAGMRGGWLINHTFLLGLGGSSTSTPFNGDPDPLGVKKPLNFSYGGILMEWIAGWDRAWHPVFGVLMGSGTASTTPNEHCGMNSCTYTLPETDSVNVLEGSARLDANMFRYFRAGLGLSYRKVWGLKFPYLKPGALNGAMVEIFLTFGKF
ncbi:MAG: hypothetical protein OEW39_08065 [Deltaproteobacteria bacterium]|nr:hypothetical protein [Deltaproteobacteria bacterium]